MSKIFSTLVSYALFLGILGLIALLLILSHYGKSVDDYRQLATYEPPITSRLYAADGRLLAEYASEKRAFVPYEVIPKQLVQAFISAEDKKFFSHGGLDFIGIAKEKIVLCLVDKEPGDWLADEERFNDEEPLWFSESSHRISPVRKVDVSRQALIDKLENADMHFDVKAFVIVQIGNIINAEDMFDIWNDIGVKVTRIDRGTPKEIPLFSKTLEEADGQADKSVVDKIKKLLRSIA